MNEELEELAALQALRLLDEKERSAFESQSAQDAELQALTTELEATVAELGRLAPLSAPPDFVKARLLERIEASQVKFKREAPRAPAYLGMFLGWGTAAALALTAAWLWSERAQLAEQLQAMSQLEVETRESVSKTLSERDTLKNQVVLAEQQIAQLGTEMDTLRKSNAMAQVQISTLESTLNEYKEGVAVVVWNSEKQEGVLRLEKMPPVAPNKDYQLWVVDPAKSAPVDAGIVRVDEKGFARIEFKPMEVITEAVKFALSVESKGGVPKNEGPIILISP